jgi:4-carboxymuconolactone decarboxylase
MRLDRPRIDLIADDDFTPEQSSALVGARNRRGELLNIFRTLAHHPEALTGFMAWASFVLSDANSLPRRERELVILRIGFRCRSGYEFTQHTRIALRCGVSEFEVELLKGDPEHSHWTAAERALLVGADELHDDQFISDSTWTELARHFTQQQRMDLVFTVGQYTQVSMILNTFGVQVEAGETVDPDLRG